MIAIIRRRAGGREGCGMVGIEMDGTRTVAAFAEMRRPCSRDGDRPGGDRAFRRHPPEVIRGAMMTRFCLALLALFLALALPAQAASLDEGFRRYLEAEIWPEARARGVPRAVFDQAFRGVSPNTKLPDLMLPGGKNTVAEINFQAEFKSGADYLSERAVAGNDVVLLEKATGKANDSDKWNRWPYRCSSNRPH